MLKFTIGLTDQSKRNIKKFPKQFQDALQPAFERIMLLAEARSKEKYFLTGNRSSPVNSEKVTSRTGNLRRIISSEVHDRYNKIYAALTADIEYAATHEYGDPGRNIQERPFLTPAIQDVIEDHNFENIINDEINKKTQWR